jgi:anti-sigma B factor antagonist
VPPEVQQNGWVQMADGGILEVTEHQLAGGLRLIDLRGEFDLATAASVRSALATADADGCPRVIIDLTGVPVIDSTALSVLVVAHKRLRRTGRELVVVLPDSGMTTKFEIAGLDRFFAISPSRAEALAGD